MSKCHIGKMSRGGGGGGGRVIWGKCHLGEMSYGESVI